MLMEKKFIKIRFNLKCKWFGWEPQYRIYVNDELFTERNYYAEEPYYYKEMLQVEAVPGVYKIKLVNLTDHSFAMSDTYIEYGVGKIHSTTRFEIL